MGFLISMAVGAGSLRESSEEQRAKTPEVSSCSALTRWKGYGVWTWTSLSVTKVRPCSGLQSDSSRSQLLTCSLTLVLFCRAPANRHLLHTSFGSVGMLYRSTVCAGNSLSCSHMISGECWTKQIKNVRAIYRSVKGSGVQGEGDEERDALARWTRLTDGGQCGKGWVFNFLWKGSLVKPALFMSLSLFHCSEGTTKWH